MKSRLLGFILMAATATVACADSPSHAAPESLAQGFVDAWNSHDGARFEKLFTQEAYWVPTVDSRLDGRDAITADLTTAHQTWAKRTTLAIDSSGVATREVSPGVAVVLFHAPFRQADGSLTVPGNAVLLVTVKHGDDWRIAAGQITKPGETVTPR